MRQIQLLAFACVMALGYLSLPARAADPKAVEITGNDMMQMNIKAFDVKPGEKVKLTFKHIGKLPKAAMGHNIVILKKGLQAFGFAQGVMQNGGGPDNDYLPDALKKKVLAYTKMCGGGESDTIEFVAPKEEGDYAFLCTFPGHVALMNGKMTVKK